MGVKDHGLGGPGPKPQKRGGPGGVPKIAKFCTRGGKFGGGVFGGVPEQGIVKHEGFMMIINMKFILIVEDDHHR